MIKKLLLELFCILFAFGVLWFIIAKFAPVPDSLPTNFSVDKEEKLGRLITDAVMESETEIKSPEVTKALNEISERLTSSLDSSLYHYNFYIIEKKEEIGRAHV